VEELAAPSLGGLVSFWGRAPGRVEVASGGGGLHHVKGPRRGAPWSWFAFSGRTWPDTGRPAPSPVLISESRRGDGDFGPEILTQRQEAME